jgi:hypothetical protein
MTPPTRKMYQYFSGPCEKKKDLNVIHRKKILASEDVTVLVPEHARTTKIRRITPCRSSVKKYKHIQVDSSLFLSYDRIIKHFLVCIYATPLFYKNTNMKCLSVSFIRLKHQSELPFFLHYVRMLPCEF